MNKTTIGHNAGLIWRTLSDNHKWDKESLKNATGLSEIELLASIGWLARENKIEFESIDGSEYFFLGYEEHYY